MTDEMNNPGAVNNWNQKFLRGVFAEENGTPSASRMLTAVVVVFACGWVTAIVLRTYALPDFGGLSLLIGTLYGINSVKNIWGRPPEGKP